MSSDDFEELVEPGFVTGGESALALRAASGRLAACAEVRDGAAGSGIRGEVAPSVAWGSPDDADFSRVTGWIAVSDMDGMGGELVPGFLLAAWWGGRLWLRYAAEVPAGESAEDEEDSAAVYGAAGSMVDGAVRGRGVGYGPSLFLVPMGEREAWLVRDGRWRVDVSWEVLAVYGVHPSGRLWGEDAAMMQERRVTLWLVPVGRALCFVATSCDRFAEDGSLAPVAERLRWSEFGRMYAESGWAAGPHVAFEAALLPWEAEGSEPWTGEDDDWSYGFDPAALCCGRVVDGVAVQRRDGFARSVSVCGRFHDSSICGAFAAMLGWTVTPRLEDVFGVAGAVSWGEVLEHGLVVAPLEAAGVYESAQDYRFDPDSVEGLGLSCGYSVGKWVLGAELWPPVAEHYRVTFRADVTTAGGSVLHLRMAGTEVDNVLLTASSFAEVVVGFVDRVLPGGGEDEFAPPDRWGGDNDDVTDDWAGGGLPPGPDDDDDVDDDSNPANRVSVKFGYERGDGFKSCRLTRRGGGYYWRLVLDGSYVSSLLRGLEVPGCVTLCAGGSQAGTAGRTVYMGLSKEGGNHAAANDRWVSGVGALAFRGSNQADIEREPVECDFSLGFDLGVEVPDRVWYLSASEESYAGSWVRRVQSDGASCFQARAPVWYKFSVDAGALRRAAVNELSARLTKRRVQASGVCRSYDSVVTASLSGNVLNVYGEAILS